MDKNRRLTNITNAGTDSKIDVEPRFTENQNQRGKKLVQEHNKSTILIITVCCNEVCEFIRQETRLIKVVLLLTNVPIQTCRQITEPISDLKKQNECGRTNESSTFISLYLNNSPIEICLLTVLIYSSL